MLWVVICLALIWVLFSSFQQKMIHFDLAVTFVAVAVLIVVCVIFVVAFGVPIAVTVRVLIDPSFGY
jgi:hypothetical protein